MTASEMMNQAKCLQGLSQRDILAMVAALLGQIVDPEADTAREVVWHVEELETQAGLLALAEEEGSFARYAKLTASLDNATDLTLEGVDGIPMTLSPGAEIEIPHLPNCVFDRSKLYLAGADGTAGLKLTLLYAV